MCLAKAYVARDSGNEMVAESVASVKVEGKTLTIMTILKETTTLEAVIEGIDFANGSVVLRPVK
jgi:hypothetical protein